MTRSDTGTVGSYIKNGTLDPKAGTDAACLAYTSVGFTPGEVGNVLNTPVNVLNAITAQSAPFLANLGCPLNSNDGSTIPGS